MRSYAHGGSPGPGDLGSLSYLVAAGPSLGFPQLSSARVPGAFLRKGSPSLPPQGFPGEGFRSRFRFRFSFCFRFRFRFRLDVVFVFVFDFVFDIDLVLVFDFVFVFDIVIVFDFVFDFVSISNMFSSSFAI